jgi:hypothetical protein
MWRVLILLALIVFIVVVFLVPPTEAVWMPKCVLKQWSGWDCPACGFQRSLHALLYGRFAEAFAYNYFFVISVPFLLLVVIGKYFVRGQFQHRWQRVVEHRYVVMSYVVLFFTWWVVRNVLGI